MLKLLIGAVFGCALGFWVGYGIASRDNPYDWWRMEVYALNREQQFAAVLSLNALLQLERGENDKLRSTLASQLAYYERHFQEYDAKCKGCAPVIPLIREASERYPILREEMAKEAAKPTSTPSN